MEEALDLGVNSQPLTRDRIVDRAAQLLVTCKCEDLAGQVSERAHLRARPGGSTIRRRLDRALPVKLPATHRYWSETYQEEGRIVPYGLRCCQPWRSLRTTMIGSGRGHHKDATFLDR